MYVLQNMIGGMLNLYLKSRFKGCKLTFYKEKEIYWMRGEDETLPYQYKTFMLIGHKEFLKAIYSFYLLARIYKQTHLK